MNNRLVDFGAPVDAVQGPLGLRYGANDRVDYGRLWGLLTTPMVSRLREVRQLGYTSHNYTAADHTRFGHAIGTMRILRAMIHRLERTGHFPITTKTIQAVIDPFPMAKKDAKKDPVAYVIHHMLAAAILQDVGELPFGQATASVFSASPILRDSVQQELDLGSEPLRDKDVFTLACLREHSSEISRAGLNLSLMAFMLTGRMPQGDSPPLPLLAVRHMLDGVVDADRLDYVYRDAHHTIGRRGNAGSIIESLLKYDHFGPVFDDPGPVSEFLVLRALMWSQVYFAPNNRFRTELLRSALREVLKKERTRKEFCDDDLAEASIGSASTFLKLDDRSLMTRLRRVSESVAAMSALTENARKAVNLLFGDNDDYQYMFVPIDVSKSNGKLGALPTELFYDTYRDYATHSLYQQGGVRIQTGPSGVRPLEECAGPFNPMFSYGWSGIRYKDHVLVFAPRKRIDTPAWSRIRKAVTAGSLGIELAKKDFEKSVELVNYWNKGRKGRRVFVCYAGIDLDKANMLRQTLQDLGANFKMLLGPIEGLGGTPSENSLRSLRDAEGILVLFSRGYVSRYFEDQKSPLALEVFELGFRIRSENLPWCPITLDDFQEIKRFPWALLGIETGETPYVGSLLRNATPPLWRSVVQEALDRIEGKKHDT